LKKGLIYRSTGSWHIVESGGVFYSCRIKGNLRLKGIKSTNPVAVGDRVIFEVENNSIKPEGRIIEVEERKNYIIRKSVNLSRQTHIIASNIDLAFLMITINNPPTFTVFIDRFLVTAEAYKIPVILLFNKIDTYIKKDLNTISSLKKIYEDIGYTAYEISAKTSQNLENVKTLMQNKIIMISGHSGVGKSTFINAIDPDVDIKTSAISDQHMQGKHTTTFAEMHKLKGGIRIIDTPGIKGFGIVEMGPQEIGNYFPEFFQRKDKCKFNNCLHHNEPNCAIKSAVKDGSIAQSRFNSYTQILSEDSNYRN